MAGCLAFASREAGSEGFEGVGVVGERGSEGGASAPSQLRLVAISRPCESTRLAGLFVGEHEVATGGIVRVGAIDIRLTGDERLFVQHFLDAIRCDG